MSEILTQFEDEDGNLYVVLSEDDDSMRNARRVPPPRAPGETTRGRVLPVPSRGVVQPRPRTPRPQAQPMPPVVQVVQAPDMITFKAGKAVKLLEVVTDGAAELVPLPAKPPVPTGTLEIDLQNQNEHRHALHAHRVLTNRIRTGGRVLSKVIQMFIEA